MEHICSLETPIGQLGIAENGIGITDIFLYGAEKAPLNDETPLLQKAMRELREYFAGRRKDFDLPLSLHGTAFQLADWAALQTIPYGETRNYRQIAELIGSPKACRAVGGANNRNPVMIIVPCHRVIGTDGSLVGYGCGLGAKRFLLELEKKYR